MKTPAPKPCPEWMLQLAASQPADLTPAERAALERHIASCASCAAVHAAYTRQDGFMDRLPGPAPLEQLPPKLLALWAAEDSKKEQKEHSGSFEVEETPMRPITQFPTQPPLSPQSPQRPARLRPARRLVTGLTAVAAALAIVLLASAIFVSRLHTSSPGTGTGTGTAGAPQQTQGATTPQTAGTTPTPGSTGYAVKVYFSKFPETSVTAVYPVNRVSPTSAVATFSIQLLIAGPTLEERSQGYFSELNSILSGPSSCSAPNPTGGPDFTLTLNMKGSTPQQGTATLQFCRQTNSPGVGTDARVKAEITATLTQFSNIKKVVILTQAGHCFGDESGADQCLK